MEGAPDIVALNEEIKNESAFIDLIQSELRKIIVGQNGMVEENIGGEVLCSVS